jgi:very-short-patch-repair endonuclease
MAMAANAPDGLLSRPFRGSDTIRMGLLTKRQLTSSAWRRLFEDVYVHESVPLTHRAKCQAVALLLPPGAAIGGASAAHLLGADVVGRDARVEVTSPRAQRIPDRPGVVTRYSELQAGDIVFRDGIPVTTPVRTAFDVARRGELDDAVVAVDALLRVCGVEPAAIAAYASAGRTGWRGVRQLGGVLAQAASGAESPMETRLRLVLTRSGLPMPVLQHRVFDQSGLFVARLDLAYVESRLGVEYDGECHWEPRAVRRDLRRQNALRALGWSLLRFTADDVLRNPIRVVAQVDAAAREAVGRVSRGPAER